MGSGRRAKRLVLGLQEEEESSVSDEEDRMLLRRSQVRTASWWASDLAPALDSSILSLTASLPALRRVPREASESLATCLLVSLEAPEVISLTFSPAALTVLRTRESGVE